MRGRLLLARGLRAVIQSLTAGEVIVTAETGGANSFGTPSVPYWRGIYSLNHIYASTYQPKRSMLSYKVFSEFVNAILHIVRRAWSHRRKQSFCRLQ